MKTLSGDSQEDNNRCLSTASDEPSRNLASYENYEPLSTNQCSEQSMVASTSSSLLASDTDSSSKEHSEPPLSSQDNDLSVTPSTSSAVLNNDGIGDNEDREDIVTMWKLLDQNLETKAQTHNLNAFNVKSILRHLIKNPTVLSKVMGIEDSDSSAIPSLKVTRSQVKGRKDKLIPEVKLKPVTEDRPRQFRDVNFDEEDEDDDYEPNSERDEDVSDNHSIIGESSDLDYEDEALDEHEESDGDDGDVTLTAKEINEMEAADTDDSTKLAISTEEHNEKTYTYPTRSRTANLNDVAIYDDLADSNFDLFGLQDEDPNVSLLDIEMSPYQEFISGTFSNNQQLADEDPDDADSDYNPIEDDIDENDDDVRYTRATQIPHREVEMMYRDLLDDEDTIRDVIPALPAEETKKLLAEHDKDVLKKAKHKVRRPVDKMKEVEVPIVDDSCTLLRGKEFPLRFRPCELDQLRMQLEQHVQILTQSVVMCYHDEALYPTKDENQKLINELDDEYYKYGVDSMFNIPNLAASIATCHDIMQIDPVEPERIKWSTTCERGPYPRPEVCLALTRSECILYPDLVPIVQAYHVTKPLREFSEADQLLLALGLIQFGHMRNSTAHYNGGKYYRIKEHLLKGKTVSQIRNFLKKARNLADKNILCEIITQAEDGYPILSFPASNVLRLDGPIPQWPVKKRPVWYKVFKKSFRLDPENSNHLEWTHPDPATLLTPVKVNPFEGVGRSLRPRSNLSSYPPLETTSMAGEYLDDTVLPATHTATLLDMCDQELLKSKSPRSRERAMSERPDPPKSMPMHCVPVIVPPVGALLIGSANTGYQIINIGDQSVFFVQNAEEVKALKAAGAEGAGDDKMIRNGTPFVDLKVNLTQITPPDNVIDEETGLEESLHKQKKPMKKELPLPAKSPSRTSPRKSKAQSRMPKNTKTCQNAEAEDVNQAESVEGQLDSTPPLGLTKSPCRTSPRKGKARSRATRKRKACQNAEVDDINQEDNVDGLPDSRSPTSKSRPRTSRLPPVAKKGRLSPQNKSTAAAASPIEKTPVKASQSASSSNTPNKRRSARIQIEIKRNPSGDKEIGTDQESHAGGDTMSESTANNDEIALLDANSELKECGECPLDGAADSVVISVEHQMVEKTIPPARDLITEGVAECEVRLNQREREEQEEDEAAAQPGEDEEFDDTDTLERVQQLLRLRATAEKQAAQVKKEVMTGGGGNSNDVPDSGNTGESQDVKAGPILSPVESNYNETAMDDDVSHSVELAPLSYEDSRSLPSGTNTDSRGARTGMVSCVPMTPFPRTPSDVGGHMSPNTIQMLSASQSPVMTCPRTPREEDATRSPTLMQRLGGGGESYAHPATSTAPPPAARALCFPTDIGAMEGPSPTYQPYPPYQPPSMPPVYFGEPDEIRLALGDVSEFFQSTPQLANPPQPPPHQFAVPINRPEASLMRQRAGANAKPYKRNPNRPKAVAKKPAKPKTKKPAAPKVRKGKAKKPAPALGPDGKPLDPPKRAKKRTRDEIIRDGLACMADPVYRNRQEVGLSHRIAEDVKQRMSMHKEDYRRMQRILVKKAPLAQKISQLSSLLLPLHADVLCLMTTLVPECQLPEQLRDSKLRKAYRDAIDMICAIDSYAIGTKMKPCSRTLFRNLAKMGDSPSWDVFYSSFHGILGSEKPLWAKLRQKLPLEYEEDVPLSEVECLDLTYPAHTESTLECENVELVDIVGKRLPKKGARPPVQVTNGQLYVLRGSSYTAVVPRKAPDSPKAPPKKQPTVTGDAKKASSSTSAVVFSKEEDMLILTAYNDMEEEDNSALISHLSKKLPYSVDQIAERLTYLLSLF